MHDTDHFMTPEEVAEFLLITTKTLSNWRTLRPIKGPKFKRFGNRIRYLHSDVLAWAEAQGHENTPAPPSATAGEQKEAKARRKAALAAIKQERDELWQRIVTLNAQEEPLG